MDKITMNEDFHKPFIKSMIVVAVVTIVAMFSSKYIIEIYSSSLKLPQKTHEYSSQKSHESDISSVDN